MRLEDSERARIYTGGTAHGPGGMFDVVWNFAKRRIFVQRSDVRVREANRKDRRAGCLNCIADYLWFSLDFKRVSNLMILLDQQLSYI